MPLSEAVRSHFSGERPDPAMEVEICYVSKVNAEMDSREARQQLRSQCVRNNTRDNVSGLLVWTPTSFFGVLEGQFALLESLFARIRADERHSDIKLLTMVEIRARRFNTWRLSYVDADDPGRTGGRLAIVAAQLRDTEQPRAPVLLEAFLR